MLDYSFRIVAACAGALVLAGCASRAENVAAAYVSPTAYQSYSCDQLAVEASRVSARAAAASNAQDAKASSDAVATGVAVVLFWPAAFLVKGDGASAAELARLKGEMDAVERASTEKRCNIQFRRPATA